MEYGGFYTALLAHFRFPDNGIMKKEIAYTIRTLEPKDATILNEMLYEAIFVPEGSVPPARDIVHSPEFSKYVKGFGEPSDLGYIALSETNQPIGAAWLRLLTFPNVGYGYVGDETPELTVSLLPDYRGKGLGTTLLERLFEKAKEKYKSISLSVWPDNSAYRLYQRLGFETVKQNDNDVVMLKRL
jgi:RimJ/RimL family protein N-acetyltransferase